MFSSENGTNKILARIKQLAGERDISPWLQSLGIPKGTVGRVKKGQRPGRELLLMLQHAERVMLPWLEYGTGPTYLVRTPPDDRACRELLSDLFADDGWTPVVATADERHYAAVLHRMTRRQKNTRKGEEEKQLIYRAVEIIAPIGIRSTRAIPNWQHGLKLLGLTPDQFRRLVEGQMGNAELFGFADARKKRQGLIAAARDIDPAELQRSIAERRRAGLPSAAPTPPPTTCAEPPNGYTTADDRIGAFSALDSDLQEKLLRIADIIG